MSTVNGVIIKADYGYSKFDSNTNPYICLEIQRFDGYLNTITISNSDNIILLFEEFQSDYHSRISTNTLVHRRCVLEFKDINQSVPVNIAPMLPSKDNDVNWVKIE